MIFFFNIFLAKNVPHHITERQKWKSGRKTLRGTNKINKTLLYVHVVFLWHISCFRGCSFY
jgi:hypothetical protein